MWWKKNLPALGWVGGILALAVGGVISKADAPKATAYKPVAYAYRSVADGQSWQVNSPKGREGAATTRVPWAPKKPITQPVADRVPAGTYALTAVPTAVSTPTGSDSLSYEMYIPRPTKKGYYEPKVVPYPVGKPVYVNGYYRQNGTYVPSHFRSLPRR